MQVRSPLEAIDREETNFSAVDTTRLPKIASEPQNTPSQPSTDFPFINISNPSQSSDPSNKAFIQKAVQRKWTKRGSLSSSERRYQEPESLGGLAFVNIQNPSQNADPGLRRFIRQKVQLRQRQEWARAETFKHSEHPELNYGSSSNIGVLVQRAREPSRLDGRLDSSSST